MMDPALPKSPLSLPAEDDEPEMPMSAWSWDLRVANYRRHHRLQDLRYDSSSKRLESYSQLDLLVGELENLQRSMEAFIEEARAATEKKGARKKLRWPREIFSRDFKSLQTRFQLLKKLSEEIRVSDRRLMEQQDNVFESIIVELGGLEMSAPEEHEKILLRATSYFTTAPPGKSLMILPLPLESYFAAFSRLRNMSEGIDDLLEERQEQSERREFLEDQGQTLTESDEDFDDLWSGVLRSAESDYNEALLSLNSAKDACDKANIKIPTWAQVTPPNSLASVNIVSEPYIEGCLNGADVKTLPDSGAAANFVSLRYAQRSGLRIDKSLDARTDVELGNGSVIKTLGTTTLRFSFAGESQTYLQKFHVLRKCAQDVVLGREFLRQTETLTGQGHRIMRRLRDVFFHRVHAMGSKEYVRGQANGVRVEAMPDTGADVSLMSMEFAKANAFVVDTSENARIWLQFADETTARAAGVVRNVDWRFGSDDTPHYTDIYVLPGLSVDMILGDDFLHRTNAWNAFKDDFDHKDDSDEDDIEEEDMLQFSFVKWLKRKQSKAQPANSSNDGRTPQEIWQDQKCEEMKLYAAAERDSKQLPEVQRPQFMESHKARFEQFMKSQPSRKPSVQQVAPPSAAAIATAQQGGQRPPVAQHSTLASVPAGRARIDNSAVPSRGAKVFSKFRSFKRGC